MSLYLWLDLLAVSVPFLVSFHPRLKLYKDWKALFLALLITLIPFIIWDIYFTYKGYWGFNEIYLSGLNLLYLPIEEWMFFICIPYACIFTHMAILEINPRLQLPEKLTKQISIALLLLFGILFLFNFNKAYTAVDMAFGLIILGWVYRKNQTLLRSFFITFLFMLIPFFIVNGILTGTGIEGNVVWYNDDQNLGIRLGTIPVEDTVYAFSLILMNLFLFDFFKKKYSQKKD
jgi:lycopene cyclase domain-containing protein